MSVNVSAISFNYNTIGYKVQYGNISDNHIVSCFMEDKQVFMYGIVLNKKYGIILIDDTVFLFSNQIKKPVAGFNQTDISS